LANAERLIRKVVEDCTDCAIYRDLMDGTRSRGFNGQLAVTI
jgi:hypothetical protein